MHGRGGRSTVFAALVWALFVCGVAIAAEPTSRPVAVSDNAFDEALGKARDQQGFELEQTLASISSRFQSIDACTTPGRNIWSIRTLNERPGQQLDALRFTVPEGTHTHLYWAFSINHLDSWYIVPVQGELKGFEEFYPNQKFQLPPAINRNLILQELPTRLTPGEEYILWFKFKQPGRVLAYISLVLLDDDRSHVGSVEIRGAVGLEKQLGK
jgi:hypothetical protein